MLSDYGSTCCGCPPNPYGKDYDDDTNVNTIADGAEMDFASIYGKATGPDCGISGFDLNALLAQGGHSCVVIED